MTPPEVRPEVRCFSMQENRMTTGIVASRDAAKRYCHSIMLNDENCVMPTVIGRLEAVEMSTVEMVYSFQAFMKMNMSVVTMPGAQMVFSLHFHHFHEEFFFPALDLVV